MNCPPPLRTSFDASKSPFFVLLLNGSFVKLFSPPNCQHGSGTRELHLTFQRWKSRVLHRPHHTGSTDRQTNCPREGMANMWLISPSVLFLILETKTRKNKRKATIFALMLGQRLTPSTSKFWTRSGRNAGRSGAPPHPPCQQQHPFQIHPVRCHRQQGITNRRGEVWFGHHGGSSQDARCCRARG